MPGWMSISALFRDAGSVFDSDFRFTPSTGIGEKDTGVLLDQIDKILVKERDTVDDFRNIYSSSEYEFFKAEHRVLNIRLQEIEQHYRQLDDRLTVHGRIPSETSQTKDQVHTQAVDLLTAVEEYQNRVIRASNRAMNLGPIAFPDEEDSALPESQSSPSISSTALATEETKPSSDASTSTLAPSPPEQLTVRLLSPKRPQVPSFIRSNIGLMKRIDTRTIIDLISSPGTATNPSLSMLQDPRCMVVVTHSLEEDSQASDPAKKVFRRHISFRHEQQIVTIADSLCELYHENEMLDTTDMFRVEKAIRDWRKKEFVQQVD